MLLTGSLDVDDDIETVEGSMSWHIEMYVEIH